MLWLRLLFRAMETIVVNTTQNPNHNPTPPNQQLAAARNNSNKNTRICVRYSATQRDTDQTSQQRALPETGSSDAMRSGGCRHRAGVFGCRVSLDIKQWSESRYDIANCRQSVYDFIDADVPCMLSHVC